MKKNNLLLLAGFFTINLLAQHNYDNQSVIYSNNGNVGIGTTTPSAKLEVVGTILAGPGTPGTGLHMGFQDAFPTPGWGNAYFDNRRWAGYFTWRWASASGMINLMRLEWNTTEGLLRLDGELRATQIRVVADVWADYVFDKDFNLRPLSEVESFIVQHKHLPDVPSEKEIKANGLDVGAMQKIHMQKIEELTLYTIEQQKLIEKLIKRIETLENK